MYNVVTNSSIYKSFPSGILKNAALRALGSASVAVLYKNPLSQIATRAAATMIFAGTSTITNLALRNYDMKKGRDIRMLEVPYEGNSLWEDKLQTYLPKICSSKFNLFESHMSIGTIALNLNLKAVEGTIKRLAAGADTGDVSPLMRENQAFAFVV